MNLALITNKTTGESIVVDFDAKTCTQPLYYEELAYPLWDYALDFELTDQFERDDWTVIRQETASRKERLNDPLHNRIPRPPHWRY